jgi:hypothetical protein
VVTEKLDGGNCCIHRGAVYARTHKHPATHPSFGPVEALAAAQLADVPPHLALFGEPRDTARINWAYIPVAMHTRAS